MFYRLVALRVKYIQRDYALLKVKGDKNKRQWLKPTLVGLICRSHRSVLLSGPHHINNFLLSTKIK